MNADLVLNKAGMVVFILLKTKLGKPKKTFKLIFHNETLFKQITNLLS